MSMEVTDDLDLWGNRLSFPHHHLFLFSADVFYLKSFILTGSELKLCRQDSMTASPIRTHYSSKWVVLLLVFCLISLVYNVFFENPLLIIFVSLIVF